MLDWIGRPVFVLLNQTGPPRPRAAEDAEVAQWRKALGARSIIRGVLALDAFARCWVQEIVLLRAIAPVVETAKREGYERVVAAWQARRMTQFDEAMGALAAQIGATARDRVALPNPDFADKVRDVLRAGAASAKENRKAARALAERLDAAVRESTARLISIHELPGRVADAVLERLTDHLRTDAPLDEGKAAMMGGVVSGAATGLAVDLMAHGLTLGAGTLIGAIAGALGGAGLARGYNVMRGRKEIVIRWDDALLDRLVTSALLRYLAVAHFGRGRGDWKESEYPAFWTELVEREVEARRESLLALWARRESDDAEAMAQALKPVLTDAARDLLDALYPGALGARSARS